jgi:hypothetical protein
MLEKKWLKPISTAAAWYAARSSRNRLHLFEKKLDHCRNVQNDLLLKIIQINQDSEFGRKHHFDKISGYRDYAESLPLTNYSYFEPYIEQCRQGQTNALFGSSQSILMFALTSGTTAAVKYIPVTQLFANTYRNGWNIWGVKALSDHPSGYLRKILTVTSSAHQSYTPVGIPCGAISGLLAQQQKFIVRQFYTTPVAVADIPDATARYYTIMRFAITEDVAFISTANPSTILSLVQTADQHAETLIRDVYDGTITGDMPIPKPLRENFKHLLKPKRKQAKELEELFSRHDRLLPQHYWDISFLANWTGGTVGMYLPQLAQYFGKVPIRDIGLLASEGRVSIPMEDNTPAGVLDIESTFFEFVPKNEIDEVSGIDQQPEIHGNFTVLQGCQLEKSHKYYVFLTNFAGLYRYNLGDIVRVTDHIGTTPVIEFLSKGSHISSITGEKLTENQVVNAVRNAADELAIHFDNFIMAPEWENPPHYKLYIESQQPLPAKDIQHLENLIDQRLAINNMEYDSKRESNRLGKIEIRQVPYRLLAERDKKILEINKGHSEQFKHRFLYNKPVDLV